MKPLLRQNYCIPVFDFIFLFQWQFKLFSIIIRWLNLLIVVVNFCYSCSVIGLYAFRIC